MSISYADQNGVLEMPVCIHSVPCRYGCPDCGTTGEIKEKKDTVNFIELNSSHVNDVIVDNLTTLNKKSKLNDTKFRKINSRLSLLEKRNKDLPHDFRVITNKINMHEDRVRTLSQAYHDLSNSEDRQSINRKWEEKFESVFDEAKELTQQLMLTHNSWQQALNETQNIRRQQGATIDLLSQKIQALENKFI